MLGFAVTHAERVLLSDLNYAEAMRDLTRRAGGAVLDEEELLFYAGPHPLPVLVNAVMRTGTKSAPDRTLARARDFFGARGRGFSVIVRAHADADLRAAAEAAGLSVFGEAPGMVLDHRLDAARAPDGVELREVTTDADARSFAAVQGAAYATYGMPPDGTPASVSAITRDDLVAFRDQYYVPNETIMAFAGDITPEEAFAAAEKYFGAWEKKTVTPPTIAPPEQPGGLRILVVDMPDAVQTQIRVGRLGIPRNHPDFLPLAVTNYIFGGGFNSRLNAETRVNRGLTYGASSAFAGALYAGDFVADTYTRTEATVETTKVILDEIRKMAGGDVTGEELTVARDYLSGVFVIATETPNQVAGRVTNAAFYGLPDDYNQTYPAKVRAMTAEQVQQMAGRYFDANSQNLVLVGNASAFRDGLKAAFPAAKYEEISADELDLMSPNLRKAAAAAR